MKHLKPAVKAVIAMVKLDANALELAAAEDRSSDRHQYLKKVYGSVFDNALTKTVRDTPSDAGTLAAEALSAINELFESSATDYSTANLLNPLSSAQFIAFSKALGDEADNAAIPLGQRVSLQQAFREAFLESFFNRLAADPAVERFVTEHASREAQLKLREQQNWGRYAERVVSSLRRPLIVDDLTLEKSYVPMRGYAAAPRSPILSLTGEQLRNALSVSKLLESWIDRGDDDDAIRLLLGGPGSGKSSELSIMAARAYARGEVRTIFVPISRLTRTDDIGKALEEFLQVEVGKVENPWTRTEGLARYLIIFDGLDEMALQGSEAMSEAERFPQRVRDTRPRSLPGTRGQVQVIISGRYLALDHLEGQFSDAAFLHMLPLFVPVPSGIDILAEEMAEPYKTQPDLRDTLWKKLLDIGSSTSDPPDEEGMPSLFRTETFRDLTDSPLHNVLLWTAYCEEGSQIAFQSRSRLFERHAREVFSRRYGRESGSAPLSYEIYEAAMRECAVCSWQMGGRAFLLEAARTRCLGTELEDVVHQTIVRDRDRPGPGLVAFYTRQAVDNVGRGAVEFTLKPYADFLVARRIISEIRYTLPQYKGGLILARPNQLTGVSAFASLMALSQLTLEIVAFLRAECQEMERDEASALRERCIRWLEEFLWAGIDIGGWAVTSQLIATQRLLVGLLTMISLTSLVLQERTEMPWGNVVHRAAQVLHAANSGQHMPLQNPLKLALAWIEFGGQHIMAMDFGFAQLSHAGMQNAEAAYCHFHDAILDHLDGRDGSFELAGFQRAMLYRADFSRARLTGSDFQEATMIEASFNAASMNGVDFYGADLRMANLRNALLTDASFAAALLHGADLRDSNLCGVDMNGAYIGLNEDDEVLLSGCQAEPDLLAQEVHFGDREGTSPRKPTTLAALGWKLADGRLVLS